MTDILCRWLNEDLRLSQVVEPRTFTKAFSNGYLLGEILHKYQLQSDFHMFMKKERSISMLNNFTRLEPALHLLGISFSATAAQELMQKKHGAAEHLVQQLYISLENRKKNTFPIGTEKFTVAAANLPRNVQLQKEPRPPPHLSQLNLKAQQQRQKKLTQDVQNEIAQFESYRRKLPSSALKHWDGCSPLTDGSGAVFKPVPNSVYIQQIRQRIKEDTLTREQRDKRVDRFLVEQAKAKQAEQDAKHEEYLLKRFTRSTKQEQCLEAQLCHIRKQKEVIINHRLFREQQVQQRREKDSQEAAKRAAVIAEQEKMARSEEIKWELDFCKRLDAERDQVIYQEHAESCKQIVDQIVDLATKVGECRFVYGNPVPGKQMKEWKEVLFSGLPLYEPSDVGVQERSMGNDSVEIKKMNILNELDYDEYTNMAGEWVWPEEDQETKLFSKNNHILGHVIARLRNLVDVPCVKTDNFPFPNFKLKVCVLGKLCSGKTLCLDKLAQSHGFHVLSIHELVNEALIVNRNKDRSTERELPDSEKELPPGASCNLTEDACITPSTQTMHKEEASNRTMEEECLPLELLEKIIKEAIHKIPADSCWILDGFPLNIIHAHLLEKALGGSVEEEQRTDDWMDLAVDPHPPEAPPPQPPALDLALLLNVSDECSVSRALHWACAYAFTLQDGAASHNTIQSSRIVHEYAADSKPDYVYMSQIAQRLSDFNEAWPKLEEWFEAKQKILIRVDANVDEEELFKCVESILLQMSRALPEGTDSPTPSLDQTNHLNSTKSIKIEKWDKIQTSTDVLGASSRMTCSSTYIDKPLPPGIPEALHIHWKNVCEMYVNSVKAILQELRLESTMIKEHFFNIKEDFKHYLGRPDLRQEILSQWQKDFNRVSEDMRSDEETKAELHLRLQELCGRLWNISEKRKEENEQETADVMDEKWFSDHTALLVNYHSMLTQVELDRFQDTFCILKKYYLSMANKPRAELPSNLTTLSLLDTSNLQALETQSQESEKDQPQNQLLHQYEVAITAINSLLPSAAQQREVETKLLEKTQEKPSVGSKICKKPHSAKNKKCVPSPPPAASPDPPEVKPTEGSMEEYTAALHHEEEGAKMRIALVKDHGLNLVNFVQQNTEQTICSMEEWTNEHFENEMKRIEELAEVVRHHIECGSQLPYELVLDCTNFYVNADSNMMAPAPPPPRPPSLEKPSQSSLSIVQLESVCQQFRHVAPRGVMSISDFSTLLKAIMNANKGRHTLPETWVTMMETRLPELVASLKDKQGLVNWRRFVLGCALPWPSPSITQLLDALQQFKARDVENTGHIDEEQNLKTLLWFPQETAAAIPEDPSTPLPYHRLSSLFKFFLQMFADHSTSPPCLNYTSMLLYLAADPNPKNGFVRALSVVVGQHLKQTSSTQLVKSMPSLDEVPEFSEVDADFHVSEKSSSNSFLRNQKVSVAALLTVLNHSCSIEDSQSEYAKLVGVYEELGYRPEESISFSILSTHAFIQHLMETSRQHQLVNIYHLLTNGRD